jgi:hypothetical protein
MRLAGRSAVLLDDMAIPTWLSIVVKSTSELLDP